MGELQLGLIASPWRGSKMLRLAAQVQARTQQLAAECGHVEQLLNRTHGLNLAAGRSETQAVHQTSAWFIAPGQHLYRG
jgi:hypothetical protein